jgi:hypothetical protein
VAETIFGENPKDFTVNLVTGSDFKQELEYGIETGGTVEETDWPVGTTLTLEFEGGQVWTADIDGALATWEEDKAEVDVIERACDVKCVYTNGTDDRVLFLGRAQRRG